MTKKTFRSSRKRKLSGTQNSSQGFSNTFRTVRKIKASPAKHDNTVATDKELASG